MAYRDDLEAALAHADSAERDLAKAREEVTRDEARIAELEKQLAAAQQRAGEAKQKKAPAPKTGLATIRFEMRAHTFDLGEHRGVPLWRFSIGDGTRKVFEMELFDECPLTS